MNKKIFKIVLVLLVVLNINNVLATDLEVNPNALTYKYSTTVEKERPKLDDVTKQLIAEYRKNPTEENKLNLRNKIGENYDAVEYCEWLSKNDATANYRLPTEMEWEQAAGHMPKDADFNSGNIAKLMPVDTYKNTLSASGAIDMWGNVWEWTSTDRTDSTNAVKGGAYNNSRTECRTENRAEKRDANQVFDNVGFRIVRIK